MMGKPQYYRMIVDCWRMFLKHLYPAMSGQVNWEILHKDALAVGRRYGEVKLIKALIFAFLDEIERVEKISGKEGE